MSINLKVISLSTAVVLAGSLGLASFVESHDAKKAIKEKPAPIELKTLSQWGVPNFEGLVPNNKYQNKSSKKGASTDVEIYRIGGSAVIRYVSNGKTSEVFVCSAPPKSVMRYYSQAGKNIFEDLSPDDVSCNPSEY